MPEDACGFCRTYSRWECSHHQCPLSSANTGKSCEVSYVNTSKSDEITFKSNYKEIGLNMLSKINKEYLSVKEFNNLLGNLIE